MLLDTPTLYFRAYYALPESIATPDGRPVNAVRGTLDFITHLVTHYRPDRLIACFDAAWRPAFRVELLPTYKTHRVAQEAPAGSGETAVEEVPDTLSPQVEMLLEVLADPRTDELVSDILRDNVEQLRQAVREARD